MLCTVPCGGGLLFLLRPTEMMNAHVPARERTTEKNPASITQGWRLQIWQEADSSASPRIVFLVLVLAVVFVQGYAYFHILERRETDVGHSGSLERLLHGTPCHGQSARQKDITTVPWAFIEVESSVYLIGPAAGSGSWPGNDHAPRTVAFPGSARDREAVILREPNAFPIVDVHWIRRPTRESKILQESDYSLRNNHQGGKGAPEKIGGLPPTVGPKWERGLELQLVSE